MDGFNPLDLLASAAELQQKHDDGPERIIITRQRRTNISKHPTLANGHKENRDLISNNNNNNVTRNKPSVVIVKKIKKVELNPELEKMFDEHNYGNAKRTNNNRTEKGSDSVVEINGGKRKRTDSDSDSYAQNQSEQSSITVGQNRDKITTVVANTVLPDESHIIHAVEHLDKDACSNRICMCKHDPKQENCLNISEGTNGCCTQLGKQNTDRKEFGNEKIDSQVKNNINRTNDTMIVKYSNSKFDRGSDLSVDSTELRSHLDSEVKLDEQTGELITKDGEEILNRTTEESGDSSKNTPKGLAKSVVLSKGNDKDLGHPYELPAVEVKNNAQSCETVCTKVTTVSTSETQNMPYMKLAPSEHVTEPVVDKPPQTLVINITRGRNNSLADTTAVSTGKTGSEEGKLVMSESESKVSDIGIIRSLLVKNKLSGSFTKDETWSKKKPVVLNIVKPRPKLDRMTACGSKDFARHSSCESLKELELSASLCTEDSPDSVHLLSPDCRNPDSVGVAESPLASGSSETSFLGDVELVTNSEGNDDSQSEVVCSDENQSKNELKDTLSAVTSSPICSKHSDSAIDFDPPSDEIMISASKELTQDSRLLVTEKGDNCDNSASDVLPMTTNGNDIPIFRFESDHCYAGLPGKLNSMRFSAENEASLTSEGEEPQTPLGSTSELSQDSGYEDVTQSPDTELPSQSIADEHADKSVMLKTLVPVLVSLNSNGSLTVHDTNLSKTLGGQMFLPDNLKLIAATSLASISQTQLILSPVAVGKNTSPILNDAPKLVPANPESIIGLLSPKPTVPTTSSQETSPLKFGKFRIGTFASFSNTGMGLESPPKLKPSSEDDTSKMSLQISNKSQAAGSGVKSGKSSPVNDSLGSLVQKVKSSLSPISHMESFTDHIQHDHDYCTKNLMPSVVSSFLEARLLSKETPKGKVMHTRGKRADSESGKLESKSGRRKRASSCILKEDSYDEFDVDSESDTHSIPEPLRPKYRADKYTEHKRTDPKVKITGSSDFQDQFVYFMNTKKRSRRRESKDIPLPNGTDRMFIPPKPGDIIVPHLTDQDIENLKIRSKLTKQTPTSAGYNSLRNEFMAAKLSNSTFSATQPTEPVVDDEKNIINTILSLENEDLGSPVPSESAGCNESMELYGHGLGADIMNLIPEHMNLTQEQMELLYSAVDEVQNSSPGLVGAEKLVSSQPGEATFQFPMAPFDQSNAAEATTASGSLLVKNTAADDSNADKIEASEPVKNNKEAIGTQSDKTESKEFTAIASTDNGETSAVEKGSSNDVRDEEKADCTKKLSDEKHEDNLSDKVVSDVQLGVTEEKPVLTLANAQVEASECASGPPVVCVTEPNTVVVPVVCQTGTLSLPDSFSNATAEVATAKDNGPFAPENNINSEKGLFPSVSITSGTGSFQSEMSSSSLPSLASEMSLPQIEKSLDLLGNDFRLDKNYLFQDSSVSDNVAPSSTLSAVQPVVDNFVAPVEPVTSLPLSSQVNFSSPSLPASQVDYNAPWIVTVSMYWNDLPAIMVNNQPYVRLVDIHKQILPAKDTGILKKRCQLMGIEVENCTEMQRYFLVQYGKAFNSKSTLIISKDNAKDLIGYYVDPQPRMSRPEENRKSIIDHRREQLRRIALARRAAVRAQKTTEKKDEIDHRDINEVSQDSLTPASKSSFSDVSKTVEVPKVTAVQNLGAVPTEGGRSQRSTRHKKINFLEMLRGDSVNHNPEEEVTEELAKKHNKINQATLEKKKKKGVKDTKVKVVKYSVEVDSSEETESTESDCTEDLETESSSDSEIRTVKKPHKQLKVSSNLIAKAKSRMKIGPKLYNKGLKVKFGMKKNRPSATSTPVAIQVLNKSTGTKIGSQIYRTKLTPQKSKHSANQSYSPPVVLSKQVFDRKTQNILQVQGQSKPQKLNFQDGQDIEASSAANQSEEINAEKGSSVLTEPSVKFPMSELMDSSELKVSATLPENILAPSDDSEMKEEIVTDKITENVNVQTETSFDESTGLSNKSQEKQNSSDEREAVEKVEPQTEENQTERRNFNALVGVKSGTSLISPSVTEGSTSVTKRKEIVQVGYDETPLRIIHRDSSPQTQQRTRSQLGELFVERYHNKKSLCIRCYTCRKLMSVDNFLRHLHDVTGVLLTIHTPRTVDLAEGDLTATEKKIWGSFLRKKELFDNNQIPSPDLVQEASLIYPADDMQKLPVTPSIGPGLIEKEQMKLSGPRIITTPVSPIKKEKHKSKTGSSDKKARIIGNVPSLHTVKRTNISIGLSQDGVRTSSRKRKVKHMDGFEDYAFKKYPRLMKNAIVEDETS